MTLGLTIALCYAVLAVLWSLFSGQLIGWLFADPATIVLASTAKEWLLIVATAFLLYWLARRGQYGPARPAMAGGVPRRLIGALIVAIVALTAFGAWLTFDQQREREVENLKTITKLKSERIGNWLQERYSDAELLRSSPSVLDEYQRWRDRGGDADSRRLHASLERFRLRSKASTVLLFDHQGRLLWTSSGLAGLTPALQNAIGKSVTDDAIEPPVWGVDENGLVHLDFVVPLMDVDKEGPVVVLRNDPAEWIWPMHEGWPTPGATAESMLFSLEGGEVVVLNEWRAGKNSGGKSRRLVGGENLLADSVKRSDSRLGETFVEYDYRGVPVMGVIQPVPTSNWFLLGKINIAEMREAILGKTVWVVLSGVFALFATLLGLLVMRQRQQLQRADAARQAQETRLRGLALLGAVTDASGVVIYAKDREGRYLLFNRGAELWTGKRAAEVLGGDDSRLFPPEQAALVMAHDREAMARQTPSTFEERLQTRQGERLFASTRGQLLDETGEVTGVFGIARDITERAEAEEKLRQSEQRFQAIVAASTDWIWETDDVWRYTYISGSEDRLLGHPVAELLGKRLFELMPDGDAADIREFLARCAARQQSFRNLEIFGIAADGSSSHFLTSASPIIDEYGKLKGYRGLHHDITDKKFSELFLRQQADELGQRNRELERFNRLMVDREIDMIGMKKTINELSRALGRAAPYRLDYLEAGELPPEEWT